MDTNKEVTTSKHDLDILHDTIVGTLLSQIEKEVLELKTELKNTSMAGINGWEHINGRIQSLNDVLEIIRNKTK